MDLAAQQPSPAIEFPLIPVLAKDRQRKRGREGPLNSCPAISTGHAETSTSEPRPDSGGGGGASGAGAEASAGGGLSGAGGGGGAEAGEYPTPTTGGMVFSTAEV